MGKIGVEITPEAERQFMTKFIELPPERSQLMRVASAVNNGIPLDFLVHRGLISKDNIEQLSQLERLSDVTYNEIIDYLIDLEILDKGYPRERSITVPDEIIKEITVKEELDKDESPHDFVQTQDAPQGNVYIEKLLKYKDDEIIRLKEEIHSIKENFALKSSHLRETLEQEVQGELSSENILLKEEISELKTKLDEMAIRENSFKMIIAKLGKSNK